MPDTFPDVTAWPTSPEINALNGTVDEASGIDFIAGGVGPDHSPPIRERYHRNLERLSKVIAESREGMFFREDYPGLTFGVVRLNYTLGGTHKHFAGATAQTVTDDDTNYVYIDSSNALVCNTTGFPADITTFYRIATVVAAGGTITSITDERGYNDHVVPQNTSTGTTGTDNASWTIDADNAGAAAASQLRFNRGSSDAEDAALEWDETNDRIKARAQHSTATLAGLDADHLAIAGVEMVDADGAAKVQSAVAGPGLDHSAGVLSVKTSSAAGTALSGDNVAIDPSDGITLDANGVAVSLTPNGGLEFTGPAGSGTVGVVADGVTTEITGSGEIGVKDGGLDGAKAANQSTSSGTPGTFGLLLRATLTAGNTVTIHNANAPFKYRVVNAWSIALSADGGTWKIDNGTNDISNAVTVTGTDKTRNEVGTIDDAYWEIAVGGTLRVVGDGALADVTVWIMLEPVA